MPPKKQIHVFQNSDKDSWQDMSRNAKINELRPSSRILISGGPNSGKTNLLKQLIVNSPPYDRIFIKKTHNLSSEFDSLNYEALDGFQDFEKVFACDRNSRVLVILEDTNYISPRDASVIEPLFSFFCSHYGWTAVIVSQTPYTIPVGIRRLMDCHYCFSGSDTRNIDMLPIAGSHKKALKTVISKEMDGHDFLKIDISRPISNGRYSINFEPIDVLKII